MSKIEDNDLRKFLFYLLSQEKASILDNPISDYKERDRIENLIAKKLDAMAQEIEEN